MDTCCLQAAEVIQSAMRGHLSRKRYLSDRSRGYHAEMDEVRRKSIVNVDNRFYNTYMLY